MPELVQLHKELKDDPDFAMVMVDTDQDEQKLKTFIQGQGMEAPHFWDPQKKITDGFKLKGFPTTFVVNEKGKILAANYFEDDMKDFLRDFKVRKKLAEEKKEADKKANEEKNEEAPKEPVKGN